MSRSPRAVRAFWLGSVPYGAAWRVQTELVAAVRAGDVPGTLLFCEHPHVYTLGRRATEDHLLWTEEERSRRQVEVTRTDRGGDITYHGPGQLVGYPIVDIARIGIDLLTYIRGLERSLIAYLATLGIASEPGGRGLTGVWSGGEKVAAIGVKMSETVVSHGFALNLTTDLEYFEGIVGCGLHDRRATSVERLTGSAPATQDAAHRYAAHFGREFGCEVAWPVLAEFERSIGATTRRGLQAASRFL